MRTIIILLLLTSTVYADWYADLANNYNNATVQQHPYRTSQAAREKWNGNSAYSDHMSYSTYNTYSTYSDTGKTTTEYRGTINPANPMWAEQSEEWQ